MTYESNILTVISYIWANYKEMWCCNLVSELNVKLTWNNTSAHVFSFCHRYNCQSNIFQLLAWGKPAGDLKNVLDIFKWSSLKVQYAECGVIWLYESKIAIPLHEYKSNHGGQENCWKFSVIDFSPMNPMRLLYQPPRTKYKAEILCNWFD